MNTMTAKSERLTRLSILRELDLDPNTETWRTPVTLGYVDGGDVYEYVKCSPVGEVDPMGLATQTSGPSINVTTRQSVLSATVDDKDFGKIKIDVKTNVRVRGDILIGARADKKCGDLAWLQVGRVYVKDAQFNYVTLKEPWERITPFTSPALRTKHNGDWFIDNGGDETNPYYHGVGPHNDEGGQGMTIYDDPASGGVGQTHVNSLYEIAKAERVMPIEYFVMAFDTYLIRLHGSDDKTKPAPLFAVHWEKWWQRATDGKTPAGSGDISHVTGGAISALPPYLLGNDWKVGYDGAGKPVSIQNPFGEQ